MDETIKNQETENAEGQMHAEEFEELDQEATEEQIAESESTADPLKEAIEIQLKKIQCQNLLLGAQTVLRVVLDKIIVAENQPGKRTMNDYKRLIKDLKKFCNTGLSRKINTDGETEPIEEESSASENSTKLMEEVE